LLARLRAISAEPRFHELAWPVVEELAALLRASGAARAPESPPHDAASNADGVSIPERALFEIVASDERETPPVRAACLIGLALCKTGPEFVQLVELALTSVSPELERAGWIAAALSGGEQAPAELELSPLRGPFDARTFPARISTLASVEHRRAALARAGRHMGPEWMEAHVLRDTGNREELFTRQVAIATCLAPAAASPSAERDALLAWLRARDLPFAFLRETAAWCLARAARVDAALVELLEQAVYAELRADGAEIALQLVQALGRPDMALEFARQILGEDLDQLDQYSQVQGNLLLRWALGRTEDGTAAQARDFAVARVLSPELDAFNRYMFVDAIGSAGPTALDSLYLLLERAEDHDTRSEVIRNIGVAAQGTADNVARGTLEAQYFHANASATQRTSALRALLRLDPVGGREFLARHGVADADPKVQAFARDELAK